MSTFSLTKGSEAALGMLARQAGSETLLLTQPARELRASLTIEPFTGLGGGMLMAELYMREQRHSMTLQRDDGANAQHLADWIEAVANGTVDTAEAIPQRTTRAPLHNCCKCAGEAIGYKYSPAGNAIFHGVKCSYHGCQAVEGAESETEAHDTWNAIQGKRLVEPSDLSAATAAFNAAARELNEKAEPLHITHRALIRNAIGLLGLRRRPAPDVQRVIDDLETMLLGAPTPADLATKQWLEVAHAAAQTELAEALKKHRIALTPEYEGRWHADLYGSFEKPLFSAEGDTPEEAVDAVICRALSATSPTA